MITIFNLVFILALIMYLIPGAIMLYHIRTFGTNKSVNTIVSVAFLIGSILLFIVLFGLLTNLNSYYE